MSPLALFISEHDAIHMTGRLANTAEVITRNMPEIAELFVKYMNDPEHNQHNKRFAWWTM
ncbi:hypothetical protein P154DRAFT_521738 [Amniculicola lignicola CBS 123094]|uniref:Uncharacterized protein n=1 Tax=Amniculicola lignicola CBS 123094 TaxID=1392246 RepID=A0A6A5WJY3_9PLEO|nr:hypothetical protein P154DRAFT_521738 [Amniculicola lignicola CBS 123094]